MAISNHKNICKKKSDAMNLKPWGKKVSILIKMDYF